MAQAGYTVLMTIVRAEMQTLPAPHPAELDTTFTRRLKYSKEGWEKQRQTPSSDTLRHMV